MRSILNFVMLMLIFGVVFSCSPKSDAVSGASKPAAENGNSTYHQTDETILTPGELTIAGEVANPGKVNLDDFYKREVVIKEALYDKEKGIEFIGAYRYRGYSLFDLLHPYSFSKKNKEAFPPSVDLYVVIENALGETVSFSWSEIFYSSLLHQTIIATEMAPIIPNKTEVNYPVGKVWKIVCANDLFAYRMLENPTKITVRSFDQKNYDIQKGLNPMFSPEVNVVMENGSSFTIGSIMDSTRYRTYFSTFYGMGMGYHPAKFFRGPELSMLLSEKFNLFDEEKMTKGMVCFVGLDGYRTIFSYSELFNRNDQVSPILAVPKNPQDGGFYRLFHPVEFYADHSVKALKEIYFFK
ncbi:MAG: hypothetical protein EOM06_00765 [Sphingobacteriia bacterium]|nr:hypothetical protein [Sphingobacteriia bacterium]